MARTLLAYYRYADTQYKRALIGLDSIAIPEPVINQFSGSIIHLPPGQYSVQMGKSGPLVSTLGDYQNYGYVDLFVASLNLVAPLYNIAMWLWRAMQYERADYTNFAPYPEVDEIIKNFKKWREYFGLNPIP